MRGSAEGRRKRASIDGLPNGIESLNHRFFKTAPKTRAFDRWPNSGPRLPYIPPAVGLLNALRPTWLFTLTTIEPLQSPFFLKNAPKKLALGLHDLDTAREQCTERNRGVTRLEQDIATPHLAYAPKGEYGRAVLLLVSGKPVGVLPANQRCLPYFDSAPIGRALDICPFSL